MLFIIFTNIWMIIILIGGSSVQENGRKALTPISSKTGWPEWRKVCNVTSQVSSHRIISGRASAAKCSLSNTLIRVEMSFPSRSVDLKEAANLSLSYLALAAALVFTCLHFICNYEHSITIIVNSRSSAELGGTRTADKRFQEWFA